jgi:hypothetical protein
LNGPSFRRSIEQHKGFLCNIFQGYQTRKRRPSSLLSNFSRQRRVEPHHLHHNLPVEPRREYCRRTNIKAEKCLIQVSNDIFSFLDRKKKSVIDCNQAELLSKEELRRRIDSQIPFEIKERKIPSYLKKDVASGIIQSPLIPKSMKNLIKAKK